MRTFEQLTRYYLILQMKSDSHLHRKEYNFSEFVIMKGELCEIECINEKTVELLKSIMLVDETFQRIANDFKIISDSTRVKILYALSQKEICVCDLAALLGMTASAISHQLRLLRERNLVKFRKEGKMVYYSLADEHVIQLIKMGSEHVHE
jgi:ArsR family transcriptional regulator, lead/cadmium/zinc/bismuth-responsive transcriptional repressor